MEYDVSVIGCGPAGLSAAIYLSRSNIKTAVFGLQKNSNLYKSHLIGNYFGFPEDINGPELLDKGIKQAKKFGAEILKREIADITFTEDKAFKLKDGEGAEYLSQKIIFATGLAKKKANIENADKFAGKGISYCAVCDGFFFKGKKTAVIGNGAYAAEEALTLTSYSEDITILSNGLDFSFSEQFKKELIAKKIKSEQTLPIKSFFGDDKIQGVMFNDGSKMEFEGIFMAIGNAGSADFAAKLGVITEGNFIKTDKDGKTNVEGIFAIGDCTGGNAQVAASVGAGCNAALKIIKELKKLENYIQYG